MIRYYCKGSLPDLRAIAAIPDFIISKMLIYNCLEFLVRNQTHDLREDIGTFIHKY